MRITNTDYRDKMGSIPNNKNVNKEKIENFSREMSESFSEGMKKDLKKLVDSIKQKGNKIVLTKDHEDVVEYKNLIRDYLKRVLNDMYELDKCTDTFESRYYLTVETVDKKLQELTDKILGSEKENISVLNLVDEIQGLLINVYK